MSACMLYMFCVLVAKRDELNIIRLQCIIYNSYINSLFLGIDVDTNWLNWRIRYTIVKTQEDNLIMNMNGKMWALVLALAYIIKSFDMMVVVVVVALSLYYVYLQQHMFITMLCCLMATSKNTYIHKLNIRILVSQ